MSKLRPGSSSTLVQKTTGAPVRTTAYPSAFVVAAPAVLDFAYGTFTLDAASITGAGTTEISGSSSYSFVVAAGIPKKSTNVA